MVGAEYGSTFTSTPSGILFNVEDVGDSSTPFSYSNGSTFVGTSGIVQAGDSLTLWTNATGTGTAEAVFTVPDFFYEAIEPQTITPTTVNPAWGGATYVWIQIVGTSEIYTLAFGGVATNNNHEIQVDTITNTWSDYGTNNPNTVTDNGSTVTLSSGTTTFVVFNKPTSASWL